MIQFVHTLGARVALAVALLTLGNGTSVAQSWPRWADDVFGPRFEYRDRYEDRRSLSESQLDRPSRQDHGDVRDGGARPEIKPVAAPIVPFPYDYPAKSIVIDVGQRKLYYVLPDNQAHEYRIGVGRDGFGWTGTETVSRKQAWPDWYPPAEMRERDPSLPEKMTGGLKNPLGAVALYLGNTLYRIHGTNDAKSIGRAESSGCFRMLNASVLHLASLTEVGTPVTVVTSLPALQASHTPKGTPPVQPQTSPAMPPAPAAQAPPEAARPQSAQAPAAPAAPQPERTQLQPAPSPTPTTRQTKRAPDYRSLRDYTLQTR